MLTETKRKKSYPFGDIEVEIYPDEFIRELNREADEALAQIKSGELKYIPLEEYALNFGVDLRNES